MAHDRWHPERDADHRQGMGRHGPDDDRKGYDPYAGPLDRAGGYHDHRPYYGSPYHTANFGIPGALGLGGRYYLGGGFFGSQGREGMDPDYYGNRGDTEVQRQMGPEPRHRGRGPRGYVRSDERINEDVHDRLTEDWVLDASDIAVSVSGGEVTMDGTVASRQDKRRAEDIVDGISGVTHVQNNLRVKPPHDDARPMTRG